MQTLKSSFLLMLPIFMVFIWILAMAEPSAQSIGAYVFYALVGSFGVAYSTIMAVEHISQRL